MGSNMNLWRVQVEQRKLSFTVDLKEGANRIETWLMDNGNNVLCSAYYTKVNLIN